MVGIWTDEDVVIATSLGDLTVRITEPVPTKCAIPGALIVDQCNQL